LPDHALPSPFERLGGLVARPECVRTLFRVFGVVANPREARRAVLRVLKDEIVEQPQRAVAA